MSIQITTLAPEEIELSLPQLVELFQDAIASGAALGFLSPLTDEEAGSFWRRVRDGVRAGALHLFVARDEATQQVLGTVQLALAPQTNGRHRADVAKMMVHRSARRQGLGRQLLQALEIKAAQLGRTTLVLDTRQGDVAEQLYQSLHYQAAGVVPEYAQSGDGTRHATVIYYKLLAA
ncbi:hypothetical protein AUC43_10680 [Hymenobacter sedentarius]|uniref:N-acetyltransferase domain-containing protein n=1 Tax=Hymenobacter sedentarius TaxID=1411621 RepID=A0A0U4BG34_9BACT|nr:GNAT family N-acetyltransferase [Hymenobacter sedentarius]ALW85515.1 hypothetical protein AUC43_10680 [Hymenobacter sedentarius]